MATLRTRILNIPQRLQHSVVSVDVFKSDSGMLSFKSHTTVYSTVAFNDWIQYSLFNTERHKTFWNMEVRKWTLQLKQPPCRHCVDLCLTHRKDEVLDIL